MLEALGRVAGSFVSKAATEGEVYRAGMVSWCPAGLGDRTYSVKVRRWQCVCEEGATCGIGSGPGSVPSWRQDPG